MEGYGRYWNTLIAITLGIETKIVMNAVHCRASCGVSYDFTAYSTEESFHPGYLSQCF